MKRKEFEKLFLPFNESGKQIWVIGRVKELPLPIINMALNLATLIGIEILYSLSYKYINFFDINSPIKGNGSKMVDAIFNDFPKDWQATVVMDWSNGFWDKMIEKHKTIDWMM